MISSLIHKLPKSTHSLCHRQYISTARCISPHTESQNTSHSSYFWYYAFPLILSGSFLIQSPKDLINCSEKKRVFLFREDLIRSRNIRDFDLEYESFETLGEGGFGTVRRCVHRETGIDRAVKIIKTNLISNIESFRAEIDALLNLDCPYIVKLVEYFESDLDGEDGEVKLVFQMCRGPDLFDSIVNVCEKQKKFREDEAVVILRHMLKAIQCCHSHNFVHRDIKPENFMFLNVNKQATLKMIDMGLAMRHSALRECCFEEKAKRNNGTESTSPKTPHEIACERAKERPGTVRYMAPEMAISDEYTMKVDIWSIGVIFAMMVSGDPLFSLTDPEEVVLKAIVDKKYVKTKLKSKRFLGLSSECKDLLSQLLAYDPNDRPSAADALQHPLIKKSYKKDYNNKSISFTPDFFDNFRTFSKCPDIVRIGRLIIAHILKESQIRDARYLFRRMDLDSNGSISKDELSSVVASFGVSIPSDFSTLFDLVDLQGNGEIDYIEFVSATLPTEYITDDNLQLMSFNYLNKDSPDPSVLSYEDLIRIFPSSGLNEEGAKEILKECKLLVDPEFNGEKDNYDLSFAEYRQCMNHWT